MRTTAGKRKLEIPLSGPPPSRRRCRRGDSDTWDDRIVRRRVWFPVLVAAKLSRHRLHDLRHTFATWTYDPEPRSTPPSYSGFRGFQSRSAQSVVKS
jgi:hypothetical protein